MHFLVLVVAGSTLAVNDDILSDWMSEVLVRVCLLFTILRSKSPENRKRILLSETSVLRRRLLPLAP